MQVTQMWQKKTFQLTIAKTHHCEDSPLQRLTIAKTHHGEVAANVFDKDEVCGDLRLA